MATTPTLSAAEILTLAESVEQQRFITGMGAGAGACREEAGARRASRGAWEYIRRSRPAYDPW